MNHLLTRPEKQFLNRPPQTYQQLPQPLNHLLTRPEKPLQVPQ